MLLTVELSSLAGDAFAAEGFDAEFGAVKASDRPDLAQFQCNGALAAAKAAKQNPRMLGEKVAARLRANPIFKDVSLAGPGFINLTLSDEALSDRANVLASDTNIGGWS
ncbi:MAG: arginine--tRNA ligase, partial [Parvularculaceae bacterium]